MCQLINNILIFKQKMSSSEEVSERNGQQQDGSQGINDWGGSQPIPQFDKDKQIQDRTSYQQHRRNLKIQLLPVNDEDEGSQSTARPFRIETSDYIVTKEAKLLIYIKKETILKLMCDKEIKIEEIIITYSIGKLQGNCEMNGDFVEIATGEGEVSFLDELYNNQILLFIKKKEIQSQQIFSLNRNAELNDQEMPQKLLLKDNDSQQDVLPKNNSKQECEASQSPVKQVEPQLPLLTRESNLDLVFLSADPLLRDSEKAFEQPLNTEQEFTQICQKIKKTEKQFSIRRDVATVEKLREALSKKPLILHISCHGDCEGDQDQRKYNLFFENSKSFCILDQIDELGIKTALDVNKNKSLVIAFVSACHSEGIGKLFKKAGVPMVIAINSLTMVQDAAAMSFAENFYYQLIIGKTPNQAFHDAKKIVKEDKDINKHLYSCCCVHKHESWCKWGQEFQKPKNENPVGGHAVHCYIEPKCNCKSKYENIHQKACTLYQNFIKKYGPSADIFKQYNIDEKPWKKDWLPICCCHAELEHKEAQKFIIVKSDDELSEEEKQLEQEVLNSPLFERPKGELVIQNWKAFEQKDQLFNHSRPEMIIGRQLKIIKIFQFIQSGEQSFLHVHGESGNGKTYIVNYAAKYALYGRINLDGAIYIPAEKVNNVRDLKKLISDRFCEKYKISYKIQYESFIQDEISRKRLLIIIDNLQNILKKEKKKVELIDFFKKLIMLNKKSKIIVISRNIEDFQGITQNDQIQKVTTHEKILCLTPINAAKFLLATTIEKSKLKFEGKDYIPNVEQLKEHPFLKSKEYENYLTPVLLQNLLKNNKLSDLGKKKAQVFHHKLRLKLIRVHPHLILTPSQKIISQTCLKYSQSKTIKQSINCFYSLAQHQKASLNQIQMKSAGQITVNRLIGENSFQRFLLSKQLKTHFCKLTMMKKTQKKYNKIKLMRHQRIRDALSSLMSKLEAIQYLVITFLTKQCTTIFIIINKKSLKFIIYKTASQ